MIVLFLNKESGYFQGKIFLKKRVMWYKTKVKVTAAFYVKIKPYFF